jgi:Predicted glycosyltransferases
MKVSLIVATVGRIAELERLFESLREQTYRDFEVIVVDQNPDDRLKELIQQFGSDMTIRWVKSTRGLSRARNVGLKYATGDVVAFPDDDCWYHNHTLRCVVNEFEDVAECDGVLGASVDETGRRTMIKGAKKPTWISAKSALWTAVSYAMFFRRDAVDRVGGFDEALGVGAGTLWGAGEETDFVIRLIKSGMRIWYNPGITVVHPQSIETPQRTTSYGMGNGRVLALHFSSLFFWGYIVPRALAGIAVAAVTRPSDAKRRWYGLVARIRGWVITRRECYRAR